MRPIFFIHIPKTAGTSFRTGAFTVLGSDRVVYDYGPTSPQTSPLTHDYIYGANEDIWGFFMACRARGVEIVSGHQPATRYAPAVGIQQTVTFLRDPVDRVISEYKALRRRGSCTTDFKSFYRRESMQNRQSRMLEDVPLEAIGFVGITEQYNESIDLINTALMLEIPIRHANRSKPSESKGTELEQRDISEIRALNRLDLQLYQRALNLFRTRQKLTSQSIYFTHGAIDGLNNNEISGWAWWSHDETSPVCIDIKQNGNLVASVPAMAPRPDLCFLKPPRGGYVGFRCALNAKPGDDIVCSVTKTNQLLLSTRLSGTSSDDTKSIEMPRANVSEPLSAGYVDLIDKDQCIGWTAKSERADRPPFVEVYINDRLVGTAEAVQFREDVRDAGFHPTGECGFAFRWPKGTQLEARDKVEVWVEEDIAPLKGVRHLRKQ